MILRDAYEVTLVIEDEDWGRIRHAVRDAKVETGYRLLFYTDGLAEARRDGQFFPTAVRAWRLLCWWRRVKNVLWPADPEKTALAELRSEPLTGELPSAAGTVSIVIPFRDRVACAGWYRLT